MSGDGIAGQADKVLLGKIAQAFLAFRWFDR